MRRPPLPLLLLALLPLAGARSGDAVPTPTPLSDTASAAAHLAPPAAKPFVVPEPTGKIELKADQNSARIEDKVSVDHPTTYTFDAPAGKLLSIGISSPKGDVRLSVYEPGEKKAMGGTLPEDGAVRVTFELSKPEVLRLVAHTTSAETPFRFEVSLGPGSM